MIGSPGLTVTVLVPVTGRWLNACVTLLAGTCALAAFGAVVALPDSGDLNSMMSLVRRRVMP